MLTFENILELFQEYLLRDPEEEVLPCKRGYVRLTWNKDSRYCVDGILCQTPEELFDLLLTDYQDFELLRRTKMCIRDRCCSMRKEVILACTLVDMSRPCVSTRYPE